MAKLICTECGAEQGVPKVCCGSGVAGSDATKLYYPAGEAHGSTERPRHCGKVMGVKD